MWNSGSAPSLTRKSFGEKMCGADPEFEKHLYPHLRHRDSFTIIAPLGDDIVYQKVIERRNLENYGSSPSMCRIIFHFMHILLAFLKNDSAHRRRWTIIFSISWFDDFLVYDVIPRGRYNWKCILVTQMRINVFFKFGIRSGSDPPIFWRKILWIGSQILQKK